MKNRESLPKTLPIAAAAFGYEDDTVIKPLGKGLINETYLVEENGREPILLQQLNTHVFQKPLDVQENYEAISRILTEKHYFIPALRKTKTGALAWCNEQEEVWRGFQFVKDSYSPDLVSSEKDVVAVAGCFGQFAAHLTDFPAEQLKPIIPHFHDLAWRFQQFKMAVESSQVPIKGDVKKLVTELFEKATYVAVFNRFGDEKAFPERVMHHDCKISNILFDQKTNAIICPVDLDTVMPGKFFSDIGDMIRTICCSVDENSTDWSAIAVNENFYRCITETYLATIGKLFTPQEKDHLPYAGLVLTYMQSLRFIADYLNGNIYYKVAYDEQNLHRAKNQAVLLTSLEQYLRKSRHPNI